MTEEISAADQQKEQAENEAIRAWYKKTLDETVREMLRTGAVTGVAIEAAPVWRAPYQVLIAKVWDAMQKSQFIWTISGENAVTDHIAGSLAATPQEAARHFALKWQMDADRLGEVARNKSNIENTEEHMEGYTEKLIQYAEGLYELASQDELWKPKFH